LVSVHFSIGKMSRVEVWRGGINLSSRLRFHTPLIEPGRRISRTRLSDKAVHTFAHGRLGAVRRSRNSPRVRYR
jgi:hypothetical protein